MPTHAIVTLDETLEHMGDQLSPDDCARIASYRAEYGAAQDSFLCRCRFALGLLPPHRGYHDPQAKDHTRPLDRGSLESFPCVQSFVCWNWLEIRSKDAP